MTWTTHGYFTAWAFDCQSQIMDFVDKCAVHPRMEDFGCFHKFVHQLPDPICSFPVNRLQELAPAVSLDDGFRGFRGRRGIGCRGNRGLLWLTEKVILDDY